MSTKLPNLESTNVKIDSHYQPRTLTPMNMENDTGFAAALEEARIGAKEGGVPIGACLVSKDGKIVGKGHNMRVQKGSGS
ncbi:MAG: cytosine deaminase [Pycnora praestabilis]|nr:MAG: cytosine deaminase [Pycnora praestabilis]